ncbi:hypothetical protein VTK73DRAFT_2691 [Phialemonium thermophilum]|uniref:Uncharacterized protein n=1 Tax=Phialemonium thermophilum TaxID=223376 RepID=A0ABR3VPW0_9PEZI
MAGSSPARRDSQQWSSPQRTDLSDIFCEDRNSEARHKLLLETAKREHERVRAEAERVYREHLQKEERQRLLEEERKEKERIRLEEQIAAERRRLQELKATRVPIPELPEPKPEPVPQPTAGREAAAAPAQPSQAPATAENQAQAAAPSSRPDPGPASSSRGPPAPDRIQDPTRVDAAPSLFARPTSSAAQAPPAQGTPPTTTQRSQPPPSVHSAQPLARQDTTAPQANGAPSSSSTTHAALGPSSTPAADRYLVVHRNLKELRKSMDLQLRTNAALKARLGDMRREIRKTVGQLTTGLGANRTQVRHPTRRSCRGSLPLFC